jgi:hypothetical protein
MKLGTENKSQLVVLAVLLGLAVLLLARAFWPSEPSPSAAVSTNSSTAGTARPLMRRTASGKMVAVTEPRLDPTLNFDLLRASEEIKYAGNGRNIFVAGSVPIPKAMGTGATDHPAAPQYTQPVIPPPPPITLKFFGFASKPGEPKKVFLLQNEDMFIAGEGDIVDRRYRVLRITNSPPAVEVEDVLNNHKQSLPMVQG